MNLCGVVDLPKVHGENMHTHQRPQRTHSFTVFLRNTGVVWDGTAHQKEIEQAEQFLKELGDVQYSVLKCFPWGAKKERFLRLTPNGIENIRPATGEVSSCHPYSAIQRVELRDLDVLVL